MHTSNEACIIQKFNNNTYIFYYIFLSIDHGLNWKTHLLEIGQGKIGQCLQIITLAVLHIWIQNEDFL